MTTRAKFSVQSITRNLTSIPKKDADGKVVVNERGHNEYENGEVHTVRLTPVYGNNDPNHENTKFWAASPSGSIEIGCANIEAAQVFELGKEYYVDFTAAE